MGTIGRGERIAAAIAAVAMSLSILAGMNQLGGSLRAGGARLGSRKIIACLRSLA